MYSNKYGNYYKLSLVRMYIKNGKASSSSYYFSDFFCIYINLLLFNTVYLFSIQYFIQMSPDRVPLEGLPDFPWCSQSQTSYFRFKYTETEWKACLCSLHLHPTVGVFCLILDVLCIDPSLQVGVIMFSLLTQVCIKFLFYALCSLVSSAVNSVIF